jgi:hypothetical protein
MSAAACRMAGLIANGRPWHAMYPPKASSLLEIQVVVGNQKETRPVA